MLAAHFGALGVRHALELTEPAQSVRLAAEIVRLGGATASVEVRLPGLAHAPRTKQDVRLVDARLGLQGPQPQPLRLFEGASCARALARLVAEIRSHGCLQQIDPRILAE